MTARAAALAALRPVLSVVLALGMLSLGLLLLGYAPLPALLALASGAFGSSAAWTATLLKASPLLLTGLAVALSFRCGVWNIGAEGQLYAGALAATAVTTRLLPGAPAAILAPLMSLAGAAGGALLAAIAGALRAFRGVSEVISTILLNFVAIQAVALAVHGPLQEASRAYPQSDALPAAALLPAFGRLHLGVAIAVTLAFGVQLLIFRTALGFRMRAVGLSPVAARFAGISPERHALVSIAIAGALAGLAGAFEVAGVTERLYEGLSPGYGYTAIAVALLARLNPLAVLPAALFFGALEAGAGAMQRTAGVPSVVTQIVQGLVILVFVAIPFEGRRAPLPGAPADGAA
ncbi:MAG TPA: ABC transporter permease [Myxococcota bacterium]|nr:ABC transporter permease [Myxococcota bacterium]